MLQTHTVTPETLRLLRRLESDPVLGGFSLVGGTSLALRLGHRESVDLDLFSNSPFDTDSLKSHLEDNYGFKTDYVAKNTLKGFIEGVFIDCITYNYELLKEDDIIDGIRMRSVPDVIAMKLAAIADNGTRIKDFIDIAFLSADYSLDQMLGFYAAKFPNSNPLNAYRALTYFDDIIDEPVKVSTKGFSWDGVKKRLFDMAKDGGKRFLTFPVSGAALEPAAAFPEGVRLVKTNSPQRCVFIPDCGDRWSHVQLTPKVMMEGVQIVEVERFGSGRLNLVDTSSGKTLLPFDVDGISNIVNGFLIIKKNEKFNYCSFKKEPDGIRGKILLEAWCEGAKPFGNDGTAQFRKDGKDYLVDTAGRISQLTIKPTKVLNGTLKLK